MSVSLPAITFEPVRSADLPLLQSWISAPHWQAWWGEPKTEIGYIRDMIEGRDSTRPFLFLLDGVPAGYIQYWFIGDWQREPWVTDNPWLGELPSDAVGVDLSIGPADLLSQGIGARVLRLFTEKLAAKGHRFIVIDPDPRNGRAVRAYEKAGYRIMPDLAGLAEDALIMRFDADAMETRR